MSTEEKRIFQLAMGRIFRMASRPAKPGDAAEYLRCRDMIMDMVDPALPFGARPAVEPNYVRDRNKGASGD